MDSPQDRSCGCRPVVFEACSGSKTILVLHVADFVVNARGDTSFEYAIDKRQTCSIPAWSRRPKDTIISTLHLNDRSYKTNHAIGELWLGALPQARIAP